MDITGISDKGVYGLFPVEVGIIAPSLCSYDSSIDIRVLRLDKFPEEFRCNVNKGQLRLHLGVYDIFKDIIIVPIKRIGNIVLDEGNYIILDTKFESNIKFKDFSILTEHVHWTFVI